MRDSLDIDLYVSPYCDRCAAVLESEASLSASLGRPVNIRRRSVLEHLDAAVAIGVRATPALVMNGRLLASGTLTPKRIQKLLRDALAGKAES